LLKLELVQLLLRLVQLLRAWLCCETGATGCLVPQLVELPLRLIEVLGALEILKLFTLGEFVDFPIGGFSPPEGRLARGFKPPAFSRFLFQSAVKSAESF
jgi:hypothetical protein